MLRPEKLEIRKEILENCRRAEETKVPKIAKSVKG
jgi:hypothetical protein